MGGDGHWPRFLACSEGCCTLEEGVSVPLQALPAKVFG